MSSRIFVDSSVLIRYFSEDDPPRALAAARLLEGDEVELIVSTGVILEVVHVLRTEYRLENPRLAELLAAFLSRENVDIADADRSALVAALGWSVRASARRIPDAILAAAAEHARCQRIVTFDEAFVSPRVPAQLL